MIEGSYRRPVKLPKVAMQAAKAYTPPRRRKRRKDPARKRPDPWETTSAGGGMVIGQPVIVGPKREHRR